MKYGLHGKLQAKDGKGKQLADLLLKAAELIKKAKGCHIYLVSMDQHIKDAVWVTEVWENKEDHDNSLNSSEVKNLISLAMPILAGQPQKGQVLDVLGGAGINK